MSSTRINVKRLIAQESETRYEHAPSAATEEGRPTLLQSEAERGDDEDIEFFLHRVDSSTDEGANHYLAPKTIDSTFSMELDMHDKMKMNMNALLALDAEDDFGFGDDEEAMELAMHDEMK